MDTIPAELDAAVQVDVCHADVSCFDQLCPRLARLTMQVPGEQRPRPYCSDCLTARLGVHRRRGERIDYTEAARQILTRAGWRLMS